MNKITVNDDAAQEYRTEEAYKTLRTNLQFSGADKKVITVTSCTPDEGKSSVSRQLAISLAHSGKKTILVDADMRKSVLLGHVTTDGKDLKGLSHFLSGQAAAEDIICSTNISKFYIITTGSFPPNPAELLGSEKFRELLVLLRRAFDYVIIDTPPLGSVIDSAVVAKNCDGAILVIEAGVISHRFAEEVAEQLGRSNCPILGAVLNKVDYSNRGGRYYGKYYGYGRYGRYYGNYYGEEYAAADGKADAKGGQDE